MNRQNKINALDEAFKGNLKSISKIKAKQENLTCMVFVHNDIYRISSIYPKLPKYDMYLDRDLTSAEYKEFLKEMPQLFNSIIIHKPSQ
jgi:hypothetical protein